MGRVGGREEDSARGKAERRRREEEKRRRVGEERSRGGEVETGELGSRKEREDQR